MNLVPTLWLGPRRLGRRPVETTLLFLAVAFGTLGTVLAFDASAQLLKTSAEEAANPDLRRISVYAGFDAPRDAIYPKHLWTQAIERYQRFPQDPGWLTEALPKLPPLETAFVRYASWAKARVGEGAPWVDAPWSLCADPGVFAQAGVELVAGRTFTAPEWSDGRRVVVVGTALLDRLFPGLPPGEALGRTIEVNPVSGHESSESVTIVGVCRSRPGSRPGATGSPDEWLALTRLPEINPQYGRGLEFVFQARTAAEVPGLLAALRTLTDGHPNLRGQALESPYENYRQMTVVYAAIEALILAVGGGTFLIALWTLGSVFRSRIPSMARSLRLLTALGADRRTLVFLGLSEILPVGLGGWALGTAAALALRQMVTPGPLFTAQDPWVLGGLAVLALGFQVSQVAPIVRGARPTDLPTLVGRHRGQPLRLVLTVAFLVLGLSVSALCLSLQQDLVRFFQTMDRPAPLWVGQTQSNNGQWFFPVYRGDVDQADLDAVGRIVPTDLWTPYFSLNDSGYDKDVDVVGPPARERQFVRTKAFARPLILRLFHAAPVAGRIPSDAECLEKKYALVTEEVARTLFGGTEASLGQVLRPVQGNFPALNGAFEVCGVYASPNRVQSSQGYPDILFIPDRELTATMLSSEGKRVYGTRLAFDPLRVDPKVLADQVVPRLAATHPDLGTDKFQSWQGGAWSLNLGDTLAEIHRGADQLFFAASVLTILFLVVSCLGVLSFLFVDVTGRSRRIAVERALGRPWAHFQSRAFVQGSLMVLAASVLALALDLALLPGLTQVLGDQLGSLLPDSRGRIGLDGPTVVVLCLGSAALAGLVALVPLVPYRRVPIAVQMRDDS